MRMITIPNQSSVANDEAGRMLPSSYYDRIVDVPGQATETFSISIELIHSPPDRFESDAPFCSPQPGDLFERFG